MNAIKNIFRVAISNIITIICGILIGFVIPKIMSVEDYGMYKTFTLYTSYVGLFSLGIIDGIVLRYGGCDYKELNERRFRAYGRWYLIVNAFFSLLLLFTAFFVSDPNYRFIIFLLASDIIALNCIGYFQQISQITQRFKEYSLRKIIQSIINILIVIGLLLANRKGSLVDFRIYSILTVLLNYYMTFWYVKTYKAISIGQSDKLSSTFTDVVSLIKKGFPLLFANLCSTLIVSLDRQFVSMFFSTEKYAKYAFAYSMLSLMTVATSAISTVFYPMLRRMDENQLKDRYDYFTSMFTVLIFGLVAAYFPLGLIIIKFLPKYIDSIPILRIIIPGIAISSSITVIIHNYYKSLDKSNDYFKNSLIILGLSALFNYLAIKLFGTMESVSIASVIVIMIWYIVCNWGLKTQCRSRICKNITFIILVHAVFYGCSFFNSYNIGLLLYILLLLVLSLLFYSGYLKSFIRSLKKQ